MKFFSSFRSEHPSPLSSEKPEEQEDFFDEEKENQGERVEIKIDTIADFIKALQLSYDMAPDQDSKNQIGYQIVKINIALNKSEYSADDVKVEEMGEGVLGLHYVGEKQSAISEELLSDFNTSSGLIAHVLEHEKMHEKGIADEGAVELLLKNRSLTTVTFYINEQRMAERAFYNVGTGKALDLYDMDSPEELLNCYLQVELEKKYKNSKTEIKNLQRDSYLDKKVNDETDSLSLKLKEGVPRFFDRLSGAEIRIIIKEVLSNLRGKK